MVGRPLMTLGLVVLVAMSLVALLAPLLAPEAPGQPLAGTPAFQPPSGQHWFGTDDLGRDVFSRVVYGTRVSLIVGIGAALIASLIGTSLGVVAGYRGGRIDAWVVRASDAVLAVPRLIILIAVMAVFGGSLLLVVVLIGITQWPSTTRLVRGEVLSLRDREFVVAARGLGFSGRRILLRHVLPNVAGIVLVATSLGVGNAIVLEAGLSFLGVGPSSVAPSWGALVDHGRSELLDAWWIAAFPSIAIVLVVTAFNLVGDGLRDIMDPRDEGVRP